MSSILRSQDWPANRPLSINRPATDRPDVLAHAAGNVRRLRQAAGLSQAALAAASGLSRRMIVGLESGDTNISLSSLDRIAAALGASFAEVVRPPDAADGRRIDGLMWRGRSEDSRAVLLGTAPARREVELWAWSLAEGDRYDNEADPQGWHDMVRVTDGVLTVALADGPRRVPAGDFLIFTSDRPYSFVNDGPGTVRFIWIIAI